MILRLTCGNGHPWVAYAPDENTHWGPPNCVKCASPWRSADKIAYISGWPAHRYLVRMEAPESVPNHEQILWADRYERREGAIVFLTGPYVVGRFRRSVGDPAEIT
jgi:hypothetical protein